MRHQLVKLLKCAAALLLATTVAGSAATSVEFEQLLLTFMQKAGDESSRPYWTAGSDLKTKIHWLHEGRKECDKSQLFTAAAYCRSGEISLTIGGKPTHLVLKKVMRPGTWGILLAGSNAGVAEVYINSDVNSQQLEPGLVKKLASMSQRKLHLTFLKKCDSAELFRLEVNGYRAAFVSETSSCGSAGCSIGLVITYDPEDAVGSLADCQ